MRPLPRFMRDGQFVRSWPGHGEGQSYLLHSIGFDA